MKNLILLTITMVVVLGFSMQAHAALNLLGQGTSADGTYNLIYDTDQDITWYDYSSYGEWQPQMDWADALSVTFGNNTYTDWRLPTTVDGISVEGYDGTTTAGFNITNSEMGHLYYTELGNLGYKDIYGTINACGYSPSSPYCLSNTGDFQNLQSFISYWSSTEYSAYTSYAWSFHFGLGGQNYGPMGADFYGLAVMDGMATTVVPEPISSIFFLTGGAVFASRRFIKRKKKT